MCLLRAIFQTGFTHHGSHLVAVACMCRDAGMGTLCLRPDWFTHHASHLVAVACMCRDAGIGTVSVGSCCTFRQCSGHHMEL